MIVDITTPVIDAIDKRKLTTMSKLISEYI